MQAKDIMSRDIAVCTPETPLQEVARLMVEFDCGAIPIVEDKARRRLIGMLTDRDITCRTVARGRNPLELCARDCVTPDVACVHPDAALDECLHAMEERQVRRIPVVDDQGCCCGIVSQADIARSSPKRKTAELVKEVSQPAAQHA